MTRKIVFPDASSSWKVIFDDERLSRLNSIGDFSLYFCDNYPESKTLIERIGDAQGIISSCGVSNDVLERLPNLDIISFIGLGAAGFIDLAEAARRGVTVTHGLSGASSVAEHTMSLMLAASRKIALGDRQIRHGIWTDLPISDLRGKTLGLIGFGRIARSITPLAQAFGMNVIAWARSPNAQLASDYDIEFVSIEALLASSDVISLHLHLNKDTEGFLSSDILRSTKPGVVIVNTAREQLLDESTVIDYSKHSTWELLQLMYLTRSLFPWTTHSWN